MQDIINAFLNTAEAKKVSYADIRTIEARRESITVRDGKVDSLGQSSSGGLGVRVIVNGRWGFAASRVLCAGCAGCGRHRDDDLRAADAG